VRPRLIALIAVSGRGQLASVLVTAAQGSLAMNQKVIAGIVLTGIMASAAAAGISRTDQSAEKGRTNPPGGDTKQPGQ
jgi:hypothetical protein